MPSLASLVAPPVRCRLPVEVDGGPDGHTPCRLVRGVLEDISHVEGVRILSLRMERRVPTRAGHYARIIFDGFPARAFHLSARLDGSLGDREVVVHVHARPNGRVGGAIGGAIRPGRSLVLQTPLGEAFDEDATGADFVCDAVGLARVWSLFRRASIERNGPLVHVEMPRREGVAYARRMCALLRERGLRTVPLNAETSPRHRPLVVTGESRLIDRLRDDALRLGSQVHAPANDCDHTGRPFDAPPIRLRDRWGATLAGIPLGGLS